MIQDIKPHRLRNEYKHLSAEEGDTCLVYRDGKVLMKLLDGKISFPSFKEVHGDVKKGIYGFAIDDRRLFLYMESVEEGEGYSYHNINELRHAVPRELAYAGVLGNHLNIWYQDNIYCGRCTSRLIHDTKERMLYCPECGNQIYPKICPAVIVCVSDGDKVLLTKYAGREYTKYALIAGFTEIGETVEETVSREVMEEVGIRVKNITYYKSQPWGFSGGLLMGFFCEADGDTVLSIDTSELSVGEWVDMEKLKDMDDGVSLTREMMRVTYERWAERQE